MTGRGVSIHHLHLALSKWVEVLSLLYARSRRKCGQFKSWGEGARIRKLYLTRIVV